MRRIVSHIGLCFHIVGLIVISSSHSGLALRGVQPLNPGRLLFITLIPNFEDHSIQFDGQSELNSPSAPLDLTGLPLNVEQDWKDENNTWNILGTIQGGRVVHDPEQNLYHLVIGPVTLGPHDELKLIFPFVNLDYSQIKPSPDRPDPAEEMSRQRTQRFTYRGGETGREIQTIDIPFTIITKTIDLILTPLVGETFVGAMNGFRLSGRVAFHSIHDFGEFSRHCQSTTNRLQHGDYRSADLLYALDYPHYFGPDVLNPIYQWKPTIIELRSELTSCQYDPENKINQVEATFSGRTFAFNLDASPFPEELRQSEFPDGNYSFVPSLPFGGVRGYEIRFGKIVLAPGDTLTITVPYAHIQVDSIDPIPDNLIHLGSEQAGQRAQIVYMGPAAFELFLPYVPQSGLYASQFPAFIRPGVSLFERQFEEFFPFGRSWLTWLVLGVGFLLLVISRIIAKTAWLALSGWLLLAVGFFYGVRGSFGLACLAVVLPIVQVMFWRSELKFSQDVLRKVIKALAALVLIALAIYLDRAGTLIFRALTEPDLSPLTPLILIMLTGALFFLLYGNPKDARRLTRSDLPTLVLFLALLALYDAFHKSLIALLILFIGTILIMKRASTTDQPVRRRTNENQFGKSLQSRLNLAFQNRIVPVALFILIVFALVNDLSSTYANEMQIRVSPLLTPIVIPFLAIVSVSISFISIALLFVLLYPFLPSRSGYIKATVFAVFLFLVFLFGIGTDNRLIAALPNIVVGRVIYYFSVPLLIGIYIDINEFMQKENKRISSEGKDKKRINFQAASSMYLRNLQGFVGTLAGIISLVTPTIYAFVSGQPVFVTYFDLLEKLVLLPI